MNKSFLVLLLVLVSLSAFRA